jgi:hypothetical protein
MKKKITAVFLPTEDTVSIGAIFKCVKPVSEADKEDDLIINENTKVTKSNEYFQAQYVYVTVSQDVESIREGDNIIEETGLGYMPPNIATKENMAVKEHIRRCRKIIATNDFKLLYSKERTERGKLEQLPFSEGVHSANFKPTDIKQLQQSFLKELVANPNGEWEVEYEPICCGNYTSCNSNCTIKGFKPRLNQDNTVNITSAEKKKMYSEAFVIWYSGMKKEQVESAHRRYIKENL